MNNKEFEKYIKEELQRDWNFYGFEVKILSNRLIIFSVLNKELDIQNINLKKFDFKLFNLSKIIFKNFTFINNLKLLNFDNIKYLEFINCIFKQEIKPDFISKINTKFSNCKFETNFIVEDMNCKSICFDDTSFLKLKMKSCNLSYIEFIDIVANELDFNRCSIEKIKMKKTGCLINFFKCIFKQYLYYKNCIFKKEVKFKDCIFEKEANFSNAKFNDNVYFNNSTFLNFADFHECEFDGVANFFGVKFCDLVNFSSAVFKDFNKTIFINLDIDNINLEKIKKSKKLQNLEKDEEKIKLLNGFRDSFRVIKHSLSSVNNSLESSKFHKLELYVKEIELELKSNLDFKNHFSTTTKKAKTKDYNLFKQEKINWKRLIHLFLTILFIVIFYFTLDVKVTDEFLVKNIYFIFVLETIIILSCAVGLVCLFKIFKFFIKILKYIFKILLKTLESCYHNLLYRKNMADYSLYLIKRTINKTCITINNKTKKYINFTEFIDASKLKLYRTTSEHHTNFTKILNFTILMVAIFGMSCYFMIFFINKFDFDISFIVLNMIFVSLFFYIIMKIGDNFYTILLLFTCLIINLSIFLTKNEYLFFILFYITLVAFGFCCFICKNNLVICLTRYIAYAISFMILISKPTLIIPALNLNSFNQSIYLEKYLKSDISTVEINKFLDKNNTIIKDEILNKKIILENYNLLKNYEKDLPKNLQKAIKKDEILSSSFKSINFIYSIILGLCLYSLQKTARRNSIVPN